MRPKKLFTGFTLVETLIYLALTLVILAVVIEMVLTGWQRLAQIRQEQALAQDATIIFERLTNEVRLAETLAEVQTKFSLVDGVVKLNDGGNERALTSPEVEATQFTFAPVSSGHSLGTTVALSLRHRNAPAAVYNFATTLVMRASYADYEN